MMDYQSEVKQWEVRSNYKTANEISNRLVNEKLGPFAKSTKQEGEGLGRKNV